jgi:hypothetical protein
MIPCWLTRAAQLLQGAHSHRVQWNGTGIAIPGPEQMNLPAFKIDLALPSGSEPGFRFSGPRAASSRLQKGLLERASAFRRMGQTANRGRHSA